MGHDPGGEGDIEWLFLRDHVRLLENTGIYIMVHNCSKIAFMK